MAKKSEIVPFAGTTEIMPGLNLREMRRSILMEGGLLKPRKQYESREERRAAARERAKARRVDRKAYLEKRGIAPAVRSPKLTKAEKKARSKELRRMRNIYLRKHPAEAKRVGVDLARLRV